MIFLVALALLTCLTVSSALTLLVVVVVVVVVIVVRIQFEPIEQRPLMANSNTNNRFKKRRSNCLGLYITFYNMDKN